MDYKGLCNRLKKVLEMQNEPVGVKFLVADSDFTGYESKNKYTICQFVMKAREGNKLLATADNIACANGGSALGFMPVPEKLLSGEFLSQLGTFCPEGAKKTMELMPRLEQKHLKGIAFAMLSEVDFDPDIILLETVPEHLMWVSLAAIYQNGGRHQFTTSVSNGICIDIMAVPYSTKKLNVSLGCYGCRNATNIPNEHLLAGFPGDQLEDIVSALEVISEKSMPRTREKKAYARLLKEE